MRMYRQPYDSFAEQVERLERELHDLRALAGPRGAYTRVMPVAAALSALVAVLAVAALGSAKTRADALERALHTAASRLEVKTQALGECESLADRARVEEQQCRIDAAAALESPAPPPVVR